MSAAMTWHKAADLSAFGDKAVIGVEIAGREVALYKLGEEYFATANICTHQFAFMSEGYVEGDCIECPLHQALFDIRTGAVKEGPPEEPLQTYPVRLDGAALLVELLD
jgi:nitrite reductase/ring-hydroxylating ferredoxin subunit